VAAIAYCPAAFATDPSPDTTSKPKDWYFFISAYGWLAGIDGIIADGGIDEDISIEGLLAGRPSGESQESFKKWLAKRSEKAP
jgi:hypothetical protein